MKMWLSRAVLRELLAQAEQFSPLETGGVLLGWREGHDRIVTGLIGPGPMALHGRYAFIPDHRWQVENIRRVFAETRGDLDYLGDWHTHPVGAAQMSEIDRRTLTRMVRKAPNAIMMIAAPSMGGWVTGAWTQAQSTLFHRAQPETCDIQVFDPPSDWPEAISPA